MNDDRDDNTDRDDRDDREDTATDNADVLGHFILLIIDTILVYNIIITTIIPRLCVA